MSTVPLVKVRANGNSLYMLIPKDIATKLGIHKGDYLTIEVKGKEMIVKKVRPVPINS